MLTNSQTQENWIMTLLCQSKDVVVMIEKNVLLKGLMNTVIASTKTLKQCKTVFDSF